MTKNVQFRPKAVRTTKGNINFKVNHSINFKGAALIYIVIPMKGFADYIINILCIIHKKNA